MRNASAVAVPSHPAEELLRFHTVESAVRSGVRSCLVSNVTCEHFRKHGEERSNVTYTYRAFVCYQ